MSPRAAWRLERLGYGPVYEYASGKVDWLAAGLPTEGEGRRERRAIDAVEEPLTCPPTATVADATERARAAGAANVLVVNAEGILLGRFRLEGEGANAAEPGEAGSHRDGGDDPRRPSPGRRKAVSSTPVTAAPADRRPGVVRRASRG